MASLRKCAVFLAGCWVASAWVFSSAAPASAAPIQYIGTGHYYEVVLVPEGIDWQTASDAANAMGGYLATTTSPGENAFVFSLVALSENYWTPGRGTTSVGPWLGGFQPDGSPEPSGGWQWVTGEPWAYTNWSANEPNNLLHEGYENRLHYGPVHMDWTWNDLYESDPIAPHGYVVEYIPEPAALSLLVIGVVGALGNRYRKRLKS